MEGVIVERGGRITGKGKEGAFGTTNEEYRTGNEKC
jgi:hypothetical protein